MDGTFDLLLLDVHLPDGCVYDTVQMLQTTFNIPIIFFSGDNEEDLILRGYDLDCITFLPKPFRPRVLMASIQAFARRNGLIDEDLSQAGWIWNKKVQTLVLADSVSTQKPVVLNESEGRIFQLLFSRLGQIVPKEMLMSCISQDSTDASLRVRLSKIRGKLPECFQIESIRKSGYRLTLKA